MVIFFKVLSEQWGTALRQNQLQRDILSFHIMLIKQLYFFRLEVKFWFFFSGFLLYKDSSFSSAFSTLLGSSSFLLGWWQFSQDYKDAGGSPNLFAILPPETLLTPTPMQEFQYLVDGKAREPHVSEVRSAAIAWMCQMRKGIWTSRSVSQAFRPPSCVRSLAQLLRQLCPQYLSLSGLCVMRWLASFTCSSLSPPPSWGTCSAFGSLNIFPSSKIVLTPIFYYYILLHSLSPCESSFWMHYSLLLSFESTKMLNINFHAFYAQAI